MASQTVISGLGSMPDPRTNGNQMQNPFGAPVNGTVISGVNNGPMPGGMQGVAAKGQLFGFLYSVSHTMAGEYWPLYLGANTIGRGLQNNITLNEATVSDNHASIHIISRKGELTVYITDSSSKVGTLLNGELLRGEADLGNGDIITIGEHYELFVILFNPVKIGLAPVEGFASSTPSPVWGGTRQGFPSMGGVAKPQMPNATVVEGQAGPIPTGGHTVVMGGPVTK